MVTKRTTKKKENCTIKKTTNTTSKNQIMSIMTLIENHRGVTKALQADILKVIGVFVEGELPRHIQSLYKFYKEKKVSQCMFTAIITHNVL